MTITQFKEMAGIAKDAATALGFLGAAVYFLYQWASGYLVVNMKVSLRCDRVPKPTAAVDYLSITASIAKGDRGSVLLQDAQVEVVASNGSQRLPLAGIERLSIQLIKEDRLSRHSLVWGTRSKQASFLNLTPGEETVFSCYCEVPRGEPCTISLALLGHRPSSNRIGQWRSSIISLPLKETTFAGQ